MNIGQSPGQSGGIRWVLFALAFFLASLGLSLNASGQDLVITTTSKFNGGGTYNVKGNIDNSQSTNAVDTIHGKVDFVGSVAETLGVVGKSTLVIDSLRADSAYTRLMNVPVTVPGVFTVAASTYAVHGHDLALGSTPVKVSGSLSAAGASDTVTYNGGSGNQSIMPATYANLYLAGAATKDLGSGTNDTAVALSQSGGALFVSQNFVVSGAANVAALGNVAGLTTFTLGTAASVIGNVQALSGTLNTGSGATTIDTLTNNTGSINGSGPVTFAATATNSGTITGGAGPVTFTAGAVDAGNITGGAGLVSFGKPLFLNTGTVQAGSGGVTFGDSVITLGGTHLASASGPLLFNAGVHNKGDIALTSAASANFAGNFSGGSIGTYHFSDSSTVTYSGGAQVVPSVKYGNLVLAGSATKSSGNDTVDGQLTLTRSLALNANSSLLLTSSISSNVHDTGEVIGNVRRTHIDTANVLYAFNGDSIGMGFSGALTGDTIGMAMTPDTLSVIAPGSHYVKRNYAFTASNTAPLAATTLSSIKLEYAQNELNEITNETKLGIRDFSGGIWSKVANSNGTFTRSADTLNNVVYETGVNTNMQSVSDLALVNNSVTSVASGNWDSSATWDEGKPGPTDDAEITAGMNVVVTGTDSINSVLIDSSGVLRLNFAGTTLSSLTVGSSADAIGSYEITNYGSLTVGDGTHSSVLSLRGASFYNGKSNSDLLLVNANGTLTMKGKLWNYGTTTNNGTIDIGQ
jgi:hypothetical protein